MDTKVSQQTRKEVLQSLRVSYHQANKADKSRVLDDFVALAVRRQLFLPFSDN
jgi:hypothetical protein